MRVKDVLLVIFAERKVEEETLRQTTSFMTITVKRKREREEQNTDILSLSLDLH